MAAARLCPPDPQWPGLAPPAPTSPVPPLDEETATADPEVRAARVRDSSPPPLAGDRRLLQHAPLGNCLCELGRDVG
jgi:hypothetical protein